MIIIGLTGGIGMGKSTVASQLEKLGVHVCNADDIVHKLIGKNGRGVEPVRRVFPSVVKDGAVDRKALGDIVFKDKAKLKQLEQILHPLVVDTETRFVKSSWRKGAKMVVLDIPLLYETKAEKRFGLVMVATAPAFIQRQRVMKRPNMTETKFVSIINSQIPDREKRRRADYIVQTGLGKGHSFRQVARLIMMLRSHCY